MADIREVTVEICNLRQLVLLHLRCCVLALVVFFSTFVYGKIQIVKVVWSLLFVYIKIKKLYEISIVQPIFLQT